MAIHRAARLATMPSIQHSPKRKPRPYDPLLDDEGLYPTEEEIALLPDPLPLLPTIATLVVEVIAGVRNISQLAAVLSDDVYQRLRDRAIAVAQNRVREGLPPKAPMLSVGALQRKDPKDGVIESVVLVQSPTRTRAVTIRLEGINHRWRATAVSVI